MKLEQPRIIRTPLCSISTLRVNGKHQCFILEDTVRPPGVKIPGQTAIPAGEYTVEITWSPKFKRELPLIWNFITDDGRKIISVGGVTFEGVRYHPGNDKDDTEGCPLNGRHVLETGTDEFKVTESQAAFKDFFSLLDGARKRQEHVGLAITNI